MSEQTMTHTGLGTTDTPSMQPALAAVAGRPHQHTASAPGGAVARRLTSLGADTAYVLMTLPWSLFVFVVVLTGLSVAFPLFIIWVGLPMAVGVLGLARGLAVVERGRVALRDRAAGLSHGAQHTGETAATGTTQPASPSISVSGMFAALARPDSWRAAAHALTAWILSIFTFTVTVTWWAGALGGTTYWFWKGFLPADDYSDLSANVQRFVETVSSDAFLLGAGLFFLLTLLPMTRAMANLQAASSRGLLGAPVR